MPAELPEPCLGINFARDGMAKKDWLALVAVHSDAWLLSVAFYYGAKLDAQQRYACLHGQAPPVPHRLACSAARNFVSWCRSQLFQHINGGPTLFEMVTGKSRPMKRTREHVRFKAFRTTLVHRCHQNEMLTQTRREFCAVFRF